MGAGNHKTFVAFLALMLLSQVLFCQVVSSMLTQTYLLQLAAPHSLTAGGLAAASSKLAGASSSKAGGLGASQGVTAAGAAAAVAAGEQGPPGAVSAVDTAAGVQGKPAASHSQGGLRLTLQALWAVGSTHTGLLLLLLAQVRFFGLQRRVSLDTTHANWSLSKLQFTDPPNSPLLLVRNEWGQ